MITDIFGMTNYKKMKKKYWNSQAKKSASNLAKNENKKWIPL